MHGALWEEKPLQIKWLVILRITKYMTNAHNSCQFMAAHAWGTVGGETLANNKMNIAIFRITKYMTNVLNSCQCKT